MRDWRTIAEVADDFGVTPQAVRVWIKTGQLDADQAKRGTWLVHESAIERFRAARHTDDTPSAARGGKPTNTSVMRRQIDPGKRYRLKGTGEVVTGAELLRRRGQA